jgi:hypothetical protein
MLSGKTWLAAGVTAGAGTLAAGYNLSGFSSAAVNGVGSSLSAGLTTGDWSKSFQTGAISAAGNYLGGLMAGGITQGLGTDNAYTQALISNYTTFGMRKLFGGDEKFDMGAIGQVDTMNLVVQDMYKSYKQKNSQAQAKTNEKSSENAADKFKDPFADIDTALSGVFTSLGRGLGQTMKQIGDTIADGAKWAYDGLVGPSETAADLGMTEADYVEWKQYQKDQAALGIDVQYSKAKIQIDESEQRGSTALHNIENFEDEYVQNGKINDKAFFKDFKNIEEFNKYLDAKLDIKRMDDSLIDITNEDATNLSKSLN